MLQLAFRNLWLRKSGTILSIAGLALASGTLFCLLAFQRGYERGLKRELEQLGAHILVVPKGCPYDAASLALHGANWPCFLKESYLSQVAAVPSVAVAAPVFMGARYGGAHHREVIVGITRDYLDLRPVWKITGSFPAAPGELLLGAGAATALNASVGETVKLAAFPVAARVAGVLASTGGPDDDFVFARLEDAQLAFKQPAALTHVLLKLRSPELLDKAVQDLRACDAGMQMNIVPLAHLFETIRHVSASARYLLAGIASVAFLVAALGVANTMLMSVLERTREIGVMRAVGASAAQVFRLIVLETLGLGFLGAFAGLIAALGAGNWIEAWLRGKIAHAPLAPLIAFDLGALLAATSFSIVVAIAAGLLPAWRAARLDPVQAFRMHAQY